MRTLEHSGSISPREALFRAAGATGKALFRASRPACATPRVRPYAHGRCFRLAPDLLALVRSGSALLHRRALAAAQQGPLRCGLRASRRAAPLVAERWLQSARALVGVRGWLLPSM